VTVYVGNCDEFKKSNEEQRKSAGVGVEDRKYVETTLEVDKAFEG